MPFNWNTIATDLEGFSGRKITLHLPKTGLPFYDCLRLYGAIELFFGIREDVNISDEGHRFLATGCTRREDTYPELVETFKILKKRTPNAKDSHYLEKLKAAVLTDIEAYPINDTFKKAAPLEKPDSTLQNGIRNIDAVKYGSLSDGSKVDLILADALFGLAGEKRVLSVADLLFLPVFEGKIDLSKIVSPVRVYYSIPNVTCVKALALLLLKTHFFNEGYRERFSALVFNTNLDQRKFSNFSGTIDIDDTAVGRLNGLNESVGLAFNVFNSLLQKSWDRKGTTTNYFMPTLQFAHWVLTPLPKFFDSVITTQEMLKHKYYKYDKLQILFENTTNIKEFFMATYPNQQNFDYNNIQKFARAISSAIYKARIEPKERSGEKLTTQEKGKLWYDEVVMLRSATKPAEFMERALILIEQGKKENQFVGTHSNNEDFNPELIQKDIGEDRGEGFNQFKQLFRMYLILESGRKEKNSSND